MSVCRLRPRRPGRGSAPGAFGGGGGGRHLVTVTAARCRCRTTHQASDRGLGRRSTGGTVCHPHRDPLGLRTPGPPLAVDYGWFTARLDRALLTVTGAQPTATSETLRLGSLGRCWAQGRGRHLRAAPAQWKLGSGHCIRAELQPAVWDAPPTNNNPASVEEEQHDEPCQSESLHRALRAGRGGTCAASLALPTRIVQGGLMDRVRPQL